MWLARRRGYEQATKSRPAQGIVLSDCGTRTQAQKGEMKMSVKNMMQQELGNRTTNVSEPKAAASRTFVTKKEGTRWGALDDWRVGGKGKGESPAARRNRLRDGR